MDLEKSRSFFSAYGMWLLTFLLALVLFRLQEYVVFTGAVNGAGGLGSFFIGLLNDWAAGLSVALLLVIPCWLLWIWRSKAAFIFFIVGAILFFLIQASLVRYFLTTKTLLGADLFGYSFSEIKTTVNSSSGLTASDLIPLLFLVAFAAILWFFRKTTWKHAAKAAVVFLLIGATNLFLPNALSANRNTASHNLSLNKTAYFVADNLGKPTHSSIATNFQGYPLQRLNDTKDVLSPFFNLSAQKPDIVFLIIEGLGRDFTGPNAEYGGFTPYLDSLEQHSLSWTNFLSSAGRSFEGLPSILGSLPYGKNGFNELGQQMPDHLSLINILKKNNYYSSFFYGGDANFDYQDIFLERQGIDLILQESKFGPGYQKSPGVKNFSWGYADKDLFKKSMQLINERPNNQPQFNTFFTLSTHEPFALPDQATYDKEVATRMAALPSDKREAYNSYKDVWAALLYSDQGIRSFMEAYSKNPRYANTIFVITGDHRLIPVSERNAICRYHVPLLIYSPMLKHPARFGAISSHLDLAPSFSALLGHYPETELPASIHWLGKGLDTGRFFNPAFEMPFMRNKNAMDDYLKGDQFLAGEELFTISDGMNLQPSSNDEARNDLFRQLDRFRQLNKYVCNNNKLYKDMQGFIDKRTVVKFTKQEDALYDQLRNGLEGADTLFQKARQLAFAGKYPEARLLCRKILAKSPNYHDVRILYGRTFAWDKQHNVAVEAFKEVVRRNPATEDAYVAWIDTEMWSDKVDSAQLLVTKGLAMVPQSKELQLRQAKIYRSRKQKDKAKALVLDILKKNPGFTDAKKFYDQL